MRGTQKWGGGASGGFSSLNYSKSRVYLIFRLKFRGFISDKLPEFESENQINPRKLGPKIR